MADPYLEGDSAPVRTDHTAVDLAVTGTTPEGTVALTDQPTRSRLICPADALQQGSDARFVLVLQRIVEPALLV